MYEYTNGQLRVMRVNTGFRKFFGPEYRVDPQLGVERQPCLTADAAKALAETFRRTALEKEPSECAFPVAVQGKAPRQVRMTLRYWGRNEETRIVFVRFFAGA